MSIRNAILFLPSGKGTPLLFAQIRRRGPASPIQSSAVLVDGGVASRYFEGWWRSAFPSRVALPKERIANPDGTGTTLFWDAFS